MGPRPNPHLAAQVRPGGGRGSRRRHRRRRAERPRGRAWRSPGQHRVARGNRAPGGSLRLAGHRPGHHRQDGAAPSARFRRADRRPDFRGRRHLASTPNAPNPVKTDRRSGTERCPPWRRRPSSPRAWMAARHRTVCRRAPRLRFAGIEIRKSPPTMPAPATRCWAWRSPPKPPESIPNWRSATRCGGLARGSRPPSQPMPTVCRPEVVMSNRPRQMRLSGSPRPAREIPATIGSMYSAAFGA